MADKKDDPPVGSGQVANPMITDFSNFVPTPQTRAFVDELIAEVKLEIAWEAGERRIRQARTFERNFGLEGWADLVEDVEAEDWALLMREAGQ